MTYNEGKRYSWCYGITLDGNFCEQTCKKRDNCVYYVEDLFRRFKREELKNEPLMNEPGKACTYYIPRKEEVEKKEVEVPFCLV